jgi:hypothetical protein
MRISKVSFAVIMMPLLAGLTIYAQIGGPRGGGFRGPEGLGGFGFGIRPWKVVTGAPYSATVTDQFAQTLADGNTVQKTTTAQTARDSQGRTYTQRTLPAMGSGGAPTTLISIFDPVAGYSYVLLPDKKIARRRAVRVPSDNGNAADGPRAHGEKRNNPNVVISSLGTQTIQGVAAEGTSRTVTVPAGKIGNEKPIISTSTVWKSPDLQVVVQATSDDPRRGKSTYTLTNIQRAEPNAALFQVPAGYSIEDTPVHHGRP